MTRRNYLFAGSHAGTERAAIAYSIIGTCDLVSVSPVHYLADVLPTLARGVFTSAELAELTPAAWKKAWAPAEVAPWRSIAEEHGARSGRAYGGEHEGRRDHGEHVPAD